jgi:hypothetical protein
VREYRRGIVMAEQSESERVERAGPWLFSPTSDALVFGGSAAFGLALVALRRVFHLGATLPEWGFLLGIVAVDVAHVYATSFRTYFDADELRRRPLRYLGVPALAYLGGVLAHSVSAPFFWRLLAYLAVFHFVRQQAGWLALYRARARDVTTRSRLIDAAAIYSATGYPLVYWHAHLADRAFAWFLPGDFVDIGAFCRAILPAARAIEATALILFAVNQAIGFSRQGRADVGKIVVVTSTALTWYVGIVATNSDFDFTVTNVFAHGIPYLWLVFTVAKKAASTRPTSFVAGVTRAGFATFFGILLLLAFVEEAAWDRLAWHERPWLFGASHLTLGAFAAALVVPLLAAPQITHYILDGFIWRRRETAGAFVGRAPFTIAPSTLGVPDVPQVATSRLES